MKNVVLRKINEMSTKHLLSFTSSSLSSSENLFYVQGDKSIIHELGMYILKELGKPDSVTISYIPSGSKFSTYSEKFDIGGNAQYYYDSLGGVFRLKGFGRVKKNNYENKASQIEFRDYSVSWHIPQPQKMGLGLSLNATKDKIIRVIIYYYKDKNISSVWIDY